MIHYVPHDRIDKKAWDLRLEHCANKHWYGASSTLDAAAPGWDALIDEQRGAIMPLPWRRKFGIRYLYQPFLIQHLGPYAPDPDPSDTSLFLRAIPERFRFIDIQVSWGVDLIGVTERQNITVDLRSTKEELKSRYSEHHRRNVRKAEAAELAVDPHPAMDELMRFLLGSEQFQRWGIDAMQRAAMERIIKVANERGELLLRGVRERGVLVAGAFFVRWGEGLVFLKGLANARGRSVRAMFLLLDSVISEHAGRSLVLDMAGSSDPELARFYIGFGGRPSVYLRATVNRLPFLLRPLKA